MARVTASLALNIINPNVWYGFVARATNSKLVISDGVNTAVYQGYGLTYGWDGTVIGGTVTAYSQFYSGAHVATLDGFAAPAVIVQAHVNSNDIPGFLRAVMDGGDTVSGSPYGDWIATYGGDDVIAGNGGDDYIVAGAGNDTIFLSAGRSTVDGGAGFDVVSLPGNGGSYAQVQTPTGWSFASAQTGASAFLTNVERVAFSNGVLAFDTDGSAGQAYRIYQAAFARSPDAEGLGFWVNAIDQGYGDTTWLAANFIGSDEFKSKYGTPASVTDARFVELVYQNVLLRLPDESGYAFWTAQLDAGMSRASLLAHFSESPENKINVAPEIEQGIWLV